MKRLCFILLSLCLVLCCFAGCTKEENPSETGQTSQVTEEPTPVFPEVECTDVAYLVKGEYLGREITDCGLPEDSLFMIGDGVYGYDYVSLGGIEGTLTCYFADEGVYSFLFGSDPYEKNEAYKSAFETLNDLIASSVGTDVKDPTFTGGETEDEMTALFEGKGVLICEYTADGYTVSVTGCGVNGVATIAIECKTVKKGG